jgi:hypothetical protein
LSLLLYDRRGTCDLQSNPGPPASPKDLLGKRRSGGADEFSREAGITGRVND